MSYREYQPNSGLYVWQKPNLTPNNIQNNIKLAMFDLDGTLIFAPKALYPNNQTKIPLELQWIWLPNRENILQQYKQQGYTLICLTNQKSGPKTLPINLTKLNDFFTKSPIDLLLAATQDNHYRKPSPDLYQAVLTILNLNKNNIANTSFFCGDAAGRPGDFSDSDLQLVNNINANYYNNQQYIKFYTPQQIFAINPINPSVKPELIILVGMPGSGKTTLAQHIAKQTPTKNWFILDSEQPVNVDQGTIIPINRLFKTMPQQHNAIKQALQQGRSIIIAMTNPSTEKRAKFIETAKQVNSNIDVRIIWLMRDGSGFNKLRVKPVPTIAYSTYFKYLDIPSLTDDKVLVEYIWF